MDPEEKEAKGYCGVGVTFSTERDGLLVTYISPDSDLANPQPSGVRGLQRGDLIVGMTENGQRFPVYTGRELHGPGHIKIDIHYIPREALGEEDAAQSTVSGIQRKHFTGDQQNLMHANQTVCLHTFVEVEPEALMEFSAPPREFASTHSASCYKS